MGNLAQNLELDSESNNITQPKLEVVQERKQRSDRDSLSENFNSELDAWARQALASNGFGDY
jgi:hypothetical protein